MWVFDGEEWTQEGGSESSSKHETATMPMFDEFYPELQIVEIVPTPRPTHVPPLPLP